MTLWSCDLDRHGCGNQQTARMADISGPFIPDQLWVLYFPGCQKGFLDWVSDKSQDGFQDDSC